jgi:hypothetical protein
MMVRAMLRTIRPAVKADKIRAGRKEDRDEEYDRDFTGLDLGDAENAIGMFLPVIMVMKGKNHAYEEAKIKRARKRERADCPLYRGAPGKTDGSYHLCFKYIGAHFTCPKKNLLLPPPPEESSKYHAQKSISSTSKTSVALGGIRPPPAPCAP